MCVHIAAGRCVDVGDVGDMRHVHPLHVAVRHRIGRPVHLARAQRNPANGRPYAQPDRHPHAGADKGDHRRGIDRTTFATLAPPHRHPSPTIMPFHPTAIMERRESPGRIIHPGPAPGRHERPMAVPIGCPAGVNRRIPNLSILRRIVPRADAHHRIIAGHLLHFRRRRRHVGDRHRRMIAIDLGGEEIIAHFVDHRAREGIIRTADLRCLMRADRQTDARAGDRRRTFPHGDKRGRLRVADDDFIRTGAGDHHRAARGADGVAVTWANIAQMQIDTPLRGGGDEIGIVELIDGKFAGLIESDAASADVEIGRCTRLRPESVAGRHRFIQRRRFPMILVGAVERHRATGARDPADTGRRISGLHLRHLRHAKRGAGGRRIALSIGRSGGTTQNTGQRGGGGEAEGDAMLAHGRSLGV